MRTKQRDSSILTLDYWTTPASNYPRQRVGDAEIATHRCARGIYECYGVGGFALFEAIKPLSITNLKIRRRVWMVDDPPHWLAMMEHARQYHGHVVCAGLGLGLIVHALAQNRAVNKITVVEINPDVIRMVKPLVPECEVVQAHFWDWSGKPDGVLYDLFTGKGRDLLDSAIAVYMGLKAKFPKSVIRIHGFNNDALVATDSWLAATGDSNLRQRWRGVVNDRDHGSAQ